MLSDKFRENCKQKETITRFYWS